MTNSGWCSRPSTPWSPTRGTTASWGSPASVNQRWLKHDNHHISFYNQHQHHNHCLQACPDQAPPPYLQCSNCSLGFPDPWDLMEHVQVMISTVVTIIILLSWEPSTSPNAPLVRKPTLWTSINCADPRNTMTMTTSLQVLFHVNQTMIIMIMMTLHRGWFWCQWKWMTMKI